ncbi:MAG: alkaline phosphatase family protein [Proteobacteria bacterium]|nr:alkaline phosphatase family protein [Pseudomonadota bacterium]
MTRPRNWLRAALAGLIGAGSAIPASAGSETRAGAGQAPRLVLVVVIDQLRRDRLDASLPGGLGRLAREGRVFPQAALQHAVTATCPGHASIATGRHPGRTGLVGNEFIDKEAGRGFYCVEDSGADALTLGGEEGRSPRLLRVDTLGDWLKAAHPEARVFAVSGKDRGAIPLAGHRGDAAYWLDRDGALRFTTSRYYREDLPDWVQRWNGADPIENGYLAALPERWEHAVTEAEDTARPDDYRYERPDFRRVSGHPLRAGDLEDTVEQLYRTPYLDLLTLDFARELALREGLGRGPAPDLLGVSLSATDTIGHYYGPRSHEARDALLRLDRALGVFLDQLEADVGPVLVALSADHGVLEMPEWLAQRGASRCPVEGGRTGLFWLWMRLQWELHSTLSPFSFPRTWMEAAGTQLHVNRALARGRGVGVHRVVEVAERFLEAEGAIAEAWNGDEIAHRRTPMAQLFRNSYDHRRSGELAIELEPTCLVSGRDEGTDHGSPHLYDRAVPLVFYGPGVAPGSDPRPAATVDLAPTLAALLGIAAPGDLDGRALLPHDAAP